MDFIAQFLRQKYALKRKFLLAGFMIDKIKNPLAKNIECEYGMFDSF